jgi:predicted nuclease of restriction endonuclease-like (RecB) superfamily
MAKSETRMTGAKKEEIVDYERLLSKIVVYLESARGGAARAVNALMTAAYWAIGRQIVEFEQGGESRAAYGQEVLKRLSLDLTNRFGRGFSERNLRQIRKFYLLWDDPRIRQTASAESDQPQKRQTLSAEFDDGLPSFPLTWSHYVRLMSVDDNHAREFYETEALRGGWTVRQLDRQIQSQFFERTALSKNKAAMLKKGEKAKPEDAVTPEEAIKDPFILEFLNLKDEYCESDLEEALIQRLETFLLELGPDFAFVGRQKRLRVGDAWYRIDLLFFHRRLRCLVIIDLKLGKLTHADAGQMHLYCNYAKENWTLEDENPPVGLILCAESDRAVAHYALDGLPNKILAAEYQTKLPDADIIAAEIERTRRMLESRNANTKY